MTRTTQPRRVALPDGGAAYFEITEPAAGYADVAFTDLSFEHVLEAVEGVASALGNTLKKLKPSSASVELGVELSAKEGKLLAIFVQGEGKANLKITLEWGGS